MTDEAYQKIIEEKNYNQSTGKGRFPSYLPFLFLLLLPIIHLPTGVRTLEALNIKMYLVLPISIFIFLGTKGKLTINKWLFFPITTIIGLNIYSYNPTQLSHSFWSFTTLCGFFLIFYGFYKSSFCIRDITIFMKASIGIAAVLSLYSILQQLGYDLLGLKTWDGISATFPNRNFLAGYLAFFLLITLYILSKSNQNNLLLVCSTILIGDGLILSQTRGAWVSLIAGIILIILIDMHFLYSSWNQCREAYYAKIPVFLLIVSLISFSTWGLNHFIREPISMKERVDFLRDVKNSIISLDLAPIEETKSFSIKMRYLYWKMAIDMIYENPGKGKGIGHFRSEYYPYLEKYLLQKKYMNADRRRPVGVDNDYLEFWIDGGIANVFSYLFLIIYTFFRGLQWLNYAQLQTKTKVKERAMILCQLLGGITIISFHGIFHYSLHDPTMGSIFWMSMAIFHANLEGRVV